MSASRLPSLGDAPPPDARDDAPSSPDLERAAPASTTPFATATHAALFDEGSAANLCDVCGEVVPPDDEDEDENSTAVPGTAFLLWVRGDEARQEEAPLCASCAAALGLSALARWELDEEEG